MYNRNITKLIDSLIQSGYNPISVEEIYNLFNEVDFKTLNDNARKFILKAVPSLEEADDDYFSLSLTDFVEDLDNKPKIIMGYDEDDIEEVWRLHCVRLGIEDLATKNDPHQIGQIILDRIVDDMDDKKIRCAYFAGKLINSKTPLFSIDQIIYPRKTGGYVFQFGGKVKQ